MNTREARYGVAYDVALDIWATDGVRLLTPVFAAGDVRLIRDGAAPVQTDNLPAAVGNIHLLTLTAAEMQAKQIIVEVRDQDGPAFADQVVEIVTIGDAQAYWQGNFDFVDAAISSRATSAEVQALNNLSTAEVRSEVAAALNVDTYSEPTSPPGAVASLVHRLGWITMWAVNRTTFDANNERIFDNAGTSVVGTRSVTDDGVTLDKGKAT